MELNSKEEFLPKIAKMMVTLYYFKEIEMNDWFKISESRGKEIPKSVSNFFIHAPPWEGPYLELSTYLKEKASYLEILPN